MLDKKKKKELCTVYLMRLYCIVRCKTYHYLSKIYIISYTVFPMTWQHALSKWQYNQRMGKDTIFSLRNQQNLSLWTGPTSSHYITQRDRLKPQEDQDLFEDLQELWPAKYKLQEQRPPGFSIKRSSMNHKAVSWKNYTICTRAYHSWLLLYR